MLLIVELAHKQLIISINDIANKIKSGEYPNPPVFVPGNITPYDARSMGKRWFNFNDNSLYTVPYLHHSIKDNYIVIGVGSEGLDEIPCLTFSGRTTVHIKCAKMFEDYHNDWEILVKKIKSKLYLD